MAKLPRRHQSVVVELFLENQTDAEIELLLQVSEWEVAVLRHEALAMLARELHESDQEAPTGTSIILAEVVSLLDRRAS